MSDDGTSSTAAFTVAVIDVNEYPVGPVSDSDRDIDNALSENALPGSYTGITLSAADEDDIAVVTYALADSSDGLFVADTDTGVVTLRGDLDYERSTRHTIVGRAMSSDGSAPTTAAFTIAVIDVNEFALGAVSDSDLDTDNALSENASAGSYTGITLNAIDGDRGAVVTYRLLDSSDGLFLADTNTGLVTLRGELDYERSTQHTVVARAMSDDGSSSTAAFTIAVIDASEYPVGAVSDSDQAADNELPEDAGTGFYAGITLSAADRDSGDIVTYALADSNGGLFAVDDNSGRVTLQGQLDYERSTRHAIIARAMSDDGTSSTAAFTVNVIDVNEFALGAVADSDLDADNALSENASAGSYTGITLSAIDGDRGAIVTYGLLDSSGELFLADTNTGLVTLRGELDYERSTRHTVVARAMSDDGTSSTAAFTVAVTDANEFELTKVADSDPADNELSEETAVGSYANITLSAIDEDRSAVVTYTLLDSSGGIFAVDGDSGRVTLRVRLDYERSTRHTIIGRARSSDGSAPSTQTFTIAVTDFNEFDLTQVADSDPADNALPESAAASSDAGITLSATDGDGTAIVTYELIDSSGGLFAVGGDSGVVTLQGSLNYERSTRHAIIARAMSSDGSASTTAAFTIAVIDVNEFELTAVSDSDAAADELPENAAEDSYAGITLSATDGDRSAIVTYTLLDSSGGRFAVDDNSGRVTLRGSLDYEQSTRHTITAQAMSSDGSDPTMATFIIIVANINELALRDRDGRNNVVVSSAGAAVSGMTLEAAHSDAAPIADWELRQTVGLFELTQAEDNSTQGIRIRADAENLSSYTDTTTALSVIARTKYDLVAENYAIRISGQQIDLVGELKDIDTAPDEVAENSSAGAPVGIAIQAANATTYALGDDAGGRFAISSTGLVTVADGELLDFEDAATHSITAQASNTSDSLSTSFTISVTDVNEFAVGEVSDTDDADNTLPEDASAGAYAGITLSAIDGDGSAIVTYALLDSSDGLFVADTDTGVVTLQGSLDYERSTRHTIIARAMSSDGSPPTMRAFTVTVTDVNEFPVGTVSDSDQLTANAISEDALAGDYAGITLSAIDGDGSAIVTYELIDSGGGLFAVDGGRVTLRGSLDYEQSTRHTVIAQAMSDDGSSSTAAFAIAVIDVNEYPVGPVSDSDDAENTLPEDASAGERTNITLSAADRDGSAVVAYALLDSNDGLFVADTNTGVVTLRGRLDYERSTRHTIIARAMSDDGSSSTAAFTVNVTDFNEFDLTPVTDTDPADNELPENAVASSHTGITLSAADGDDSAVVTYALADSNGGLFVADTNTGLVTLRGSLDYERSTRHTIIAQAMSSDGSAPTMRAFTIAVIDVNEFPVGAVTDTDAADNALPEDASAGERTNITLSAEDGDGSAIVTYRLLDSSDGLFVADTDTGVVTLRGSLDYESSTRHTIIAQAMSSDGSTSTTRNFTIAVTDVNEYPVGPVSDSDQATDNELPEDALAGSYAGITLSAIDQDGSAIVAYALLDSSDGLFVADTDTGLVTLRGSLDYEQSIRHTIIGLAMSSDGSAPSTAAFIINVTDVNEFDVGPVSDSDRNIDNALPENALASSYTGITLSATDRDGSAVVTYRLLDSSDGLFVADTNTGVVTLRGSLDYEQSIRHTIIALAMSDDGSNSTAAFTVAVIDVSEFPVGPVSDADAADNELPEDALAGSYAGITLSAEDEDGSAVIAYALADSNGGIFAVDEDSGRVILRGSLDYERSIRHTIIAQAMSSDGSDPSTAAFTVNVTDVNEFPVGPVSDSDQDAENELPESASAGAYAGITLSAEDEDGSAAVAYALADSSDNLFAIDEDSGRVILRGSLDYERSTRHTIIGQAMSSDGSPPSTAAFIIIVTDVNEFPVGAVSDSDQDTDNELLENASAGSYAGITLSAEDEDGSAAVAYALADSSDNLFAIDEDSGRVILRGSLDYERSTRHTIIGQAMSDDGSSSTAVFTVNVTDFNEFPVGAVTDSDPVDNELPENASAGDRANITLSAADGDGSAIVTYALLDSNDGLFVADTDTGVVTLRGELDYECSTRHTIIGQAMSSDGSAPTTAAFAIAVIDVNEFPVGAVSDSDPVDNDLPENASAGDRANITLSAADGDGSAIVTYALLDSNDGLFVADTDTGVVTLRGELDYERSTRHTIIARAMSDDGSSSTAAFTVAVMDCQ